MKNGRAKERERWERRRGEEGKRERGKEVWMEGVREGGTDVLREGESNRGLMRMEGERCQQHEICSYTFGQGSVRMVVIGSKEGAKFKHTAVL